MPTEKILGIDLGTTNTVVGVIENGDPTIIPNKNGDEVTPSVVAFSDRNEKLVGREAVNQAVQNPTRTITSIKRKMGREDYSIDIGTNEFTPEEISGFILREVKESAEEYVGEDIQRAVITVPAYFNDRQRQATKQAGKLAELDVERIINEPTAAAIAYGIDDDRDQTILVFDLGGGTFDVSLLDLGNGVYDVIATNGDDMLGGDDWDSVLVDYISNRFEEEHGISLKDTAETRVRLEQACEDAKKTLTNTYNANINLPFITTNEDGPITLDDHITREHFRRLSTSLIQRLEDPVEQVLEDGGKTTHDIDDVILVGGATRMPMVKDKVEEMLGIEPMRGVDPDKAVALGATVQAGLISGEAQDTVLLDVTPLTLGIEVQGGLFEPLIPRNSTLPTEASKVYTTSKDNQRSVNIRVFQGEEAVAERNEFLDEFILDGIPRAEAGTPEIEVTFRINLDGILEVRAQDLASGSTEEVEIRGGSGLAPEKLEEMKEKQQRIEKISQEQKMLNRVKQRSEELVATANRVLKSEDVAVGVGMAGDMETEIENIEAELATDEPDIQHLKELNENLYMMVGQFDPANTPKPKSS